MPGNNNRLVDLISNKILNDFKVEAYIKNEEDFREKDIQRCFNTFAENIDIDNLNFYYKQKDDKNERLFGDDNKLIIFEKSRKFDGCFVRNNEKVYIEIKPVLKKYNEYSTIRDGIFQTLTYTVFGDYAISVIWSQNILNLNKIQNQIKNAKNWLKIEYKQKDQLNLFIVPPFSKEKSNNTKKCLDEIREKFVKIIKYIKNNKIEEVANFNFKQFFDDDDFYLLNDKPYEYVFNKNYYLQFQYKLLPKTSAGVGDQILGSSLLYSLLSKNHWSIAVILCNKNYHSYKPCQQTQILVDRVWEKTGSCWIFKGVFNNKEVLWAPKELNIS